MFNGYTRNLEAYRWKKNKRALLWFYH
jgi:hypothetical protein